eukprot:TRINITY_DN2185_c0_g1_i1.p2 TRINITY_DN2185_c0_g1~~TRINITY_DN2185_c0_g1_i1.p2  ORF type:complete len:222 (+),score=25.79 TRINITY_DN2185_c0_g1_i1:164-829(+)
MSDLQSLFSSANKVALACEQQIKSLEEVEAKQSGSGNVIAAQVKSKLDDLQSLTNQLDTATRALLTDPRNAQKAQAWKHKVSSLISKGDAIRSSLSRFDARERKRVTEEQYRQELFQRSREGKATAQQMSQEAAMRQSVQNSRRMLEENFDTGTGILSHMQVTRDQLKRTQRRVLDMINSLGLSESLLKLIERRQRMDMWLVYGGMVVVVIFLMLLVWWFI